MNNNKQQTAVEWLEQEIKKLNIKVNGAIQVSAIRILEQAKQMEKQQMEDVWDDSRVEDFGDNYIGKQKSFNDYYNETFKTKNQ